MRTTVRLDDELIQRAKRYGLKRGKTLTSIIRESLVAYLARGETPSTPGKLSLPTCGSGGTLPGVDLDDSARLADLMDGRE